MISNNPFQITFTLKQHTPIIHFQHDQDGATLRASEVKPKLDRFIINELGGVEETRELHPNWFLGEHNSLSYKLYIYDVKETNEYKLDVQKKTKRVGNEQIEYFVTEDFPMMLTNMGGQLVESDLKNLAFSEVISLKIVCYDISLINFIKNYICSFFFKTNFGNRQSKGFGSFYPDESIHGKEIWFKQPAINLFFDVLPSESDSDTYSFYFDSPFMEIDLFYRTLRGGLNLKKRLRREQDIKKAKQNETYHKGSDGNDYEDIFYFKSLMFLFAKEKFSANWEKRVIKKKFFPKSKILLKDGRELYFPYRLDEQELERANSDQLTYSSNDYYLFRDILGFSSDESWRSYKADIHKYQAIKNGNNWEILTEKKRSFDRFSSPILFKPIGMLREDGLVVKRVFIILQQISIDDAFKINRDFIISDSRKQFKISYPSSFNILEYFEFILDINHFDINNHVDHKFHNTTEFETLEDIYSQLRKNRKL